jgi:hypothetical protein
MLRYLRKVMLGLGAIGVIALVADWASGGGPAIGIGFGGGGGSGGAHGGVGYGGGGGHHGGSSVQWGVNVPLGDGGVRIGVGSGGHYPGGYGNPYGNHYYDRDYYYGGNSRYYYSGNAEYYQPSGVRYLDSSPNSTYYAQRAVQEPPPVPTAGQLGRMSDEQLADLIRGTGERYQEELDGFTTGDTWKKYFKLPEIIEIAKKSKTNPPDAESRTTLVQVRKRMDSASAKAEYADLTKSWAFKTLHAGMNEYSLSPSERAGHLLAVQVQELGESLDNVSTGEGWKKYLQIDALGKLADKAEADDALPGKRLEKILAKFDAVKQNPQYQAVAELNGFASTHAGLQRYIQALQPDRSEKAALPPAPAEAETVRGF